MAKLTAAERKKLPKKVFGLPEKAPGSGSYPMPDQAHARAAMAYAKHDATPAQRKKIRAKAKQEFPDMQLKPLSTMAE